MSKTRWEIVNQRHLHDFNFRVGHKIVPRASFGMKVIGTDAERAADKFSSFFFHFSVFVAFWRFFGVLGGFGPYFQIP